jgi:ribosomal protein L29
MKKYSEMKEKSSAELLLEKDKLVVELKDLRFKKVTSVVENPARIRTVKRMIIRINTITHGRELEKIKKELNK